MIQRGGGLCSSRFPFASFPSRVPRPLIGLRGEVGVTSSGPARWDSRKARWKPQGQCFSRHPGAIGLRDPRDIRVRAPAVVQLRSWRPSECADGGDDCGAGEREEAAPCNGGARPRGPVDSGAGVGEGAAAHLPPSHLVVVVRVVPSTKAFARFVELGAVSPALSARRVRPFVSVHICSARAARSRASLYAQPFRGRELFSIAPPPRRSKEFAERSESLGRLMPH